MSEYDDPGHYEPNAVEEAVSELQKVHSTLEEIHSTLEDIKSNLTRRGDFSWLWIIALIVLLPDWSGSRLDRFTDRAWYSLNNNTDWKNVDVQKRPTECNFLHSPIGTKMCSYKKDTMIFGPEQRRNLIIQAQTAVEKNEISNRPNYVTVYWEKKEEP